MRLRYVAFPTFVAAGLIGVTSSDGLATAAAPRDSHQVATSTQALTATVVKGDARAHVTTTEQQPLAALPALARFEARMGVRWNSIWDADTDVPRRMWGPAPVVAGATRDGAIAEAAARALLDEHLALLAPGAVASDFVLVTNVLNSAGDLRTVAFAQHHHGMRVVGGAIHMAFKADRLVMLGSSALPRVVLPATRSAAIPLPQRANRAVDWIAQEFGAARLRPNAVQSSPVIYPVVSARGNGAPRISYHVVNETEVELAHSVGRWQVFVDASTGAPVARRSLVHFAQGTVVYEVPNRAPAMGRLAVPAALATHQVNGAAVTSDATGKVTWATNAAATVVPGLVGPRVRIVENAGSLLSNSLTLPVNGQALWKVPADNAEAQLSAFVFANQVKTFVKANIDPNFAFVDQQLEVNVNEQGSCNAYSTGDDIHFFPRSQRCENTGLLADVVYHEFGHSMHAHAIIEGVGAFDSALSEGLSDFLAAAVTGDNGMGRGFFFSQSPLRDLDPANEEKKWPEDVAQDPHATGEIIAGALWDLRKALIAKHGATAGAAQALKIFYGVMQRSADIPTTFVEALVADDDDGDLSNGTPNQCDIVSTFAAHGLAVASALAGVKTPVRDNATVSFEAVPRSGAGCNLPSVSKADLVWQLRGDSATKGSVPMVVTGDTWAAQLPEQADGKVIEYQVKVTLTDDAVVAFPDNKADPFYQYYVGPVTKLWCASFEDGADGWTAHRRWEVASTGGLAGDPAKAFAGEKMYGLNLTDGGAYAEGERTVAETPQIDVSGHANVRVQYYRWLGVEDGFYDKAAVMVNGAKVWGNYASASDPQNAGVHHVDKEWRFVDHDISEQAKAGKVSVRFELAADDGLSMGGWTLDDLCIVAAGPATCGNGAVDAGEACDDGNATPGDGCSARCALEDGAAAADAGCCSTTESPAGYWLLSLLGLGWIGRRRRRSARVG